MVMAVKNYIKKRVDTYYLNKSLPVPSNYENMFTFYNWN